MDFCKEMKSWDGAPDFCKKMKSWEGGRISMDLSVIFHDFGQNDGILALSGGRGG